MCLPKYLGLLGWILLIIRIPCPAQNYNDIVISEIMADPTPVIGLPAGEYLELYNRTSQPVSLKNWKLVMGIRAATFPDSIVQPFEYIIICTRINAELFRDFGKVIPLSIFSLPNDGSTVSLFSERNQLIFSVDYELNWWDTGKRNGGYSVEMIDFDYPCTGKRNWLISKDIKGGTPGKVNSINGNNPDIDPPLIERIDIAESNELRLIANKRLDSLSAVIGARIELTGRKIVKKRLESPNFNNLVITLDSPLLANEVYNLSVNNLSDCSGNLLREVSFSVGLPVKSDSGDVVLNEILFNPPEDGVDFVEIYNRSKKYINLKNWSLGNLKSGVPDVFRTISSDNFILSPFTYLALTTETEVIKQLYPTEKARNLFQLSSLPAYSNTSGGVILRNEDGKIYDRFDYNEDMQDQLIQDQKGVSMEKSDVNISSEVISNWHSASSTVGNATPGYANSQIKTNVEKDIFEVEPEAFIPDNSVNGFTKIRYKLAKSGNVATIKIYDSNGRFVFDLLKNQLIGTDGEVSWDGRSENGTMVGTGYYLILIDIFDSDGNTAQYKRKVVVVKN